MSTEADDAFRSELEPLISHMRAFARSLCGNAAEADDLVQESLAKAWKARGGYEAGTHLKSWLFTIIRNQFYSEKRRSWRQAPLDVEMAERTLIAPNNATGALELDEVRRAMMLLPDEQREALILIAVAGLPYDEAALICGCAVGTVKSRVSRGRDRLAAILQEGFVETDDILPGAAMGMIFAEAERLKLRAA
ncbi:MAG TPA: sigma-70 family RNA polymerase sigma factor [Caulobacteraceae bacterium]|nr:sigma-70 family RNA polymerase sigma factor [Caulobacteraceae bacterium]